MQTIIITLDSEKMDNPDLDITKQKISPTS